MKHAPQVYAEAIATALVTDFGKALRLSVKWFIIGYVAHKGWSL